MRNYLIGFVTALSVSILNAQVKITPPSPGQVPSSITGGSCTNQVATSISTSGVPTCTTVTSAYVTGLGTIAGKLSQFASTTSAELFGIISDETGGAGVLVGSASPTFTGTATFATANSTTLKVGGVSGINATVNIPTVANLTFTGGLLTATVAPEVSSLERRIEELERKLANLERR